MTGARGTAEQRFWRHVETGPGCWTWRGSVTTADGYGRLRNTGGGIIAAHRLSYAMHHGPIPEGAVVRHRCDNRVCVNPDHLELGTPADNVRDMDERGRRRPPRGERHGCAKLTARQVAEIRAISGEPQTRIASRYGVAQQTVSRIRTGHLWREIT